MAKKPTTTAKKPAARKPAGKLSDVKPTKADSLLRIQADDAVPAVDEAHPFAEEAAPVKAAAKKKAPARKTAAKTAATKPAKEPTARKSTAKADPRQVAMHGETRYTYVDDRGLQSLAWLAPIIDDVHAKGRVRITSAIHGEGATTLHVVLPGHEPPYDMKPGLLLHVDVDNALSFDHVTIGRMSPTLFEEAAHALLASMQPDDLNPANAVGRRADWYQRAVDVSEGMSAG